MKHFTLSLAIAFLLVSGLASAQTNRFRTKVKSKTEKPAESSRFIMKAVAESGTWKPKKEEVYEPDMEGEQDTWIKNSTVSNEYDANGNNISTTLDIGEEQLRVLTKYDAYNNRIEVINQSFQEGQWINENKTEYVYDQTIKDYPTERRTYTWNSETNQWDINYSHKKEITRNANGYITQLSVKLMNENNQYDEIERTEITYSDGDLPATSWKFSQLDENGQMVEKIRYDKINWDRSDGQILVSDEAFSIGNNRIKKADIYDDGIKTATFACTYVDGKTDFDCLIKSVSSQEEIRHMLTELDSNGSFKEEIINKFDEDGDGQLVTEDEYMVITYDEHKNPVSEEYFEIVEGKSEQTDGSKLLYTYGTNDEIIETINQGYDYEVGEYQNMEKVEASDFVFFTSGIENAETSGTVLKVIASDSSVRFEMEGMNRYSVYSATGTLVTNRQSENNQGEISLSSLPAGLYFIKAISNQQNKVTKFIKK